jgi:hypothetical protein
MAGGVVFGRRGEERAKYPFVKGSACDVKLEDHFGVLDQTVLAAGSKDLIKNILLGVVDLDPKDVHKLATKVLEGLLSLDTFVVYPGMDSYMEERDFLRGAELHFAACRLVVIKEDYGVDIWGLLDDERELEESFAFLNFDCMGFIENDALCHNRSSKEKRVAGKDEDEEKEEEEMDLEEEAKNSRKIRTL